MIPFSTLSRRDMSLCSIERVSTVVLPKYVK